MARPPKTHPLYHWRQAEGVTLQALAEELRIAQPHLSEIENWNNKPSLKLAARLHARTGIDMAAFVKAPEKVA